MQLYKSVHLYNISAWDDDLGNCISNVKPNDTILLLDYGDRTRTFLKRFLLTNGMIAYVNLCYLQEVL